uniref:Sulfotransferase n=1 Tax=Salix viminalis TaxID=40686 RepID=A0A6N2JWU2_SALVM
MLRLTTEKARAFNQVVPDFGMLASIISTTTISSNGENVPRDEIQGLVAGCPSEKNWDGSPLYFYKGVWYPFFAIRGALSFQQHFIARDTDIILTSMPKSGTTWLKALAFSVVNRNIYSPTESPLLTTPSHDLVRFFEIDLYSKSQLPDLEQLPSPRIFSSHSHYETLPQSIRSSPGCKIVYICRNPLDQLVSYFHFSRKFKRENVKPLSSIDEGFDNVCRGIQSQGPFWDSVLGYWKASLERPDKVLFLKYEDLKDDITFNLKKLAEFLGLPFSEKEEKEGVIEEISRLCSFDNLRNLEVNRTGVRPLGTPNSAFFRKAKSYGPFWDSVLGYWKASLERPDKVLFLKYEDLKDDITFNLKKLAEFLGIPFTDKEEKDGVIEEISKLCSFDNLRNLEVNRTGVRPMGTPNSAFFRKAKVGDWCNDLTPSMAERFLKIVEEKLAGSGLSFKVISSFKSSYFKNSTLSGLSKLAFQYPNTLSQKGPKTLDTKTNIVEIVIN